MPEIHRNTPPHVIPADAGTQRKTKHAIPPLRKAKGDASAASRGMPEIHRNTPPHNHVSSPLVQPVGAVREPPLPPPSPKHPSHNNVPSPASRPLPPRHSRGRGNPAKTKAPHSHHPTPITQSSACFPICTPIQNKALYQHIYGTSQLYFPLSLDSYRDVVLAFSLYKLVSDRRIWTPIKPRFDEGIKELR